MEFTKKDTSVAKGVAILIMLFHHCFLNKDRWATVPFEQLAQQKYLEYYPISFAPFSEHFVVYIAAFFKICVGMFVFLTGYGMAASYAKKKMKSSEFTGYSYIKERYLNLIINFLFIFIVVQILSLSTGRFEEVYGNGIPALFYCVIDALGLAKVLKTPLFCLTWWYMSLAVILIVTFPFAVKNIKKYKEIFLVVMFLIPRALGLGMTDITRYMLAYLLGIFFYEKNLLVKFRQFLDRGTGLERVAKSIISILILILIIKCRQNAWIGEPFYDFWDGVAPAYIIMLCYSYLTKLKIISSILSFLGKHSMNIFLIHSFYRDVYFHEFFYSFYYAWLDYLVLLVVSLLSSVILEWVKKKIGVNRVVQILHKC